MAGKKVGLLLKVDPAILLRIKEKAGPGRVNAVIRELIYSWLGDIYAEPQKYIPEPKEYIQSEEKYIPPAPVYIPKKAMPYIPEMKKAVELLPEGMGCVECGEAAVSKHRGRWVCGKHGGQAVP